MKYLIIGASGQVGRAIRKLLEPAHQVVGTGHTRTGPGLRPLDLGDPSAIRGLIKDAAPDGIFVPGGVTAVDWCEAHEAEARRICVDGTVAIRDAAKGLSIPVVYFSTDYVYSGKAGPYGEDVVPDPVSAYGRVKRDAERAAEGGIILRTSMVYSGDPDSKNFHNFVVENLKAGKPINAFSDQKGSPTYAPNIAAAAIEAMERRLMGLWQWAGPEVLTRLEMARRIAKAHRLPEHLIRPVTSEEFVLPAARPKEGGLKVDRARAAFKTPLVAMADSLREIVR